MVSQHFDWDLTHKVYTFSLHFDLPLYELERPALEDAHTLVQN